jgi:hypothetical protein
MKKQTKGEKLAREIYSCTPQDATDITNLAKKIDRMLANERKRAAWDGYALACNGVMPAGMEAIFGKRRK